MTPEVLEHAFELFAQGAQSLDRAEGGLGLGLTLVRELVSRHGGTVSAHSAGTGQGSEFVVTLPLLRGEVAE
jgi:signal transduction histidine kinase